MSLQNNSEGTFKQAIPLMIGVVNLVYEKKLPDVNRAIVDKY